MSNDSTNTTPDSVVISCDTCVMRASTHCSDCLVTVMCESQTDAVVLDLAELRAVRLLADAGLVPTLRHREAI